MDVLLYLIPIALLLGVGALAAFLWSLRSGQFDDMEGAANRILFEDNAPAPPAPEPTDPETGPTANPPSTNSD